jgi:hypothetical protein
MCKHDKEDNVEHYYNEGEYTPNVLDSSNATIGLSNSSITLNNKFLTCKFTRVKKNPTVDHYFDLDKNFYILTAYGRIEGLYMTFKSQKIKIRIIRRFFNSKA